MYSDGPLKEIKALSELIQGSLSRVYFDCVKVVSPFSLPRMPSRAFLIIPHPPRLQDPSMPPPLCSLLWLLPESLAPLKASGSYSDHVLTPNFMPGSLLSPAMDDGIGPTSWAKKHFGGRATLSLSSSPSSSYSRAESIIHMRLCCSHNNPVERNCC